MAKETTYENVSFPAADVAGAERRCVFLVAGRASRPRQSRHPLEGYNRAMFSFNERLDKAVVKPVAEAYDTLRRARTPPGGQFLRQSRDIWIRDQQPLQGSSAPASRPRRSPQYTVGISIVRRRDGTGLAER